MKNAFYKGYDRNRRGDYDAEFDPMEGVTEEKRQLAELLSIISVHVDRFEEMEIQLKHVQNDISSGKFSGVKGMQIL